MSKPYSSYDSPSNLMVNYLPANMDESEFRSLFEAIGPIKSCRLIKDRASGHNAGYGFVDFEESEHSKEAIDKLNGRKVQGKTLRVALARQPGSESKPCNLYVANLPRSMTEEELGNIMANYGKPQTIKILVDRSSGTSRGCGFVMMSRRDEAQGAMQALNGSVWPGSTANAVVKFADDPAKLKHKQQQGYGASTGYGSGGMWGAWGNGGGSNAGGYYYGSSTDPYWQQVGGYGSYDSNGMYGGVPMDQSGWDYAQAEAGGPVQADASGRFNPIGDWRRAEGVPLFVYNIGPDTDESTLYQLFGNYGEVTAVRVIVDRTSGRSRGYAFVHMRAQDGAESAIAALNGYQLWNNKPLHVSIKTPNSGM